MRDKFKDFVNTLATIKVDEVGILIRITYPCNVYPLISHFYIAKLGYAGAYLFFLFFFAPKHRLWVLVRTTSPIYFLSKNKKNIKKFY